MSASEKLKALERPTKTAAEYLEADGQGRKDEIAAILRDLHRALPQIVAVIEATDALPEFFTTDDGCVHSFVPLLDALEKALS